ncbi:MAG: hypothetical protein COC22_01160 [Flavobacteriaceae bacterium]|nr:MAG: hypothetical protein COC22_01160 [Flavobacteriaceae bacterium]
MTDDLLAPLTASDVNDIPYVELLAYLGESNRPPGGNDTIRRLLVDCHMRPGLRVLHAGCNAGFLSRELGRRSGAQVLGIDISANMVHSANRRAKLEGLADRVRHEHRDMRRTELPAESFDIVVSGGALAFVDGQREAVNEWIRLTKGHGLIGDAELYYRDQPSDALRARVSEAIGVVVPCYDRSHWDYVFGSEFLEPYHIVDRPASTRTDAEISRYCENMVRWRASGWDGAAQRALFERLVYLFRLFNENLSHMDYTVRIYRRLRPHDEPALFI